MNEIFRKFAHTTSERMGSPWAFVMAVSVIMVWAITGPVFHFSDTWQLIINTGTTIVTFLMVFLIQNTQNRDAVAVHLKLDELLRAMEGARTGLVDLEDMTDEELKCLRDEFSRLRERYSPLIADDIEAVEKELSERGTRTGRNGSGTTKTGDAAR
ncbi:low affinity iron permease family protein [Thermithiobacillus plumbiphilus]|uniref:Low affinity iron permease family protein n=1 Tax=Thermithiobacillus plumbiphilus TaxID=1729899 RepID=A0ABU9DB69_9PROT